MCPDCRIEMNSQEVHGVQIDVCPRCAGVWFDDGELSHFQQKGVMSEVEDMFVPSVERARPGSTPTNCPVCTDTVMDEYAYMYSTPVRIDGCPICHGIWVHDGELRAMESLAFAAHNQPLPNDVEHRLAMVELEAEHDQSMEQNRFFRRIMRIFSMRHHGWF